MADTRDILRKMGLFGIGVISLTQEKIEEFTQEMIKKGEMSQEEGRAFVKQVLTEKDKQVADIETTINEKIKEIIKKSGIATREDLLAFDRKRAEVLEKNTEMRARLEAIEKKLEVLERSSVSRVDMDVLEGRIKELEQTIQSITKQ